MRHAALLHRCFCRAASVSVAAALAQPPPLPPRCLASARRVSSARAPQQRQQRQPTPLAGGALLLAAAPAAGLSPRAPLSTAPPPRRAAGMATSTAAESGAAAPPPAADAIVVYCTVPDQETADGLADYLVATRLAACVNIVPGLTSVYWWEGKVQRDRELLLVIKTRAERLSDLSAAINRLHPYDVPEVVALPIAGGSAPYLQWLHGATEGYDAAAVDAATARAERRVDGGGSGDGEKKEG